MNSIELTFLVQISIEALLVSGPDITLDNSRLLSRLDLPHLTFPRTKFAQRVVLFQFARIVHSFYRFFDALACWINEVDRVDGIGRDCFACEEPEICWRIRDAEVEDVICTVWLAACETSEDGMGRKEVAFIGIAIIDLSHCIDVYSHLIPLLALLSSAASEPTPNTNQYDSTSYCTHSNNFDLR